MCYTRTLPITTLDPHLGQNKSNCNVEKSTENYFLKSQKSEFKTKDFLAKSTVEASINPKEIRISNISLYQRLELMRC